jgi:hypothetical protein
MTLWIKFIGEKYMNFVKESTPTTAATRWSNVETDLVGFSNAHVVRQEGVLR